MSGLRLAAEQYLRMRRALGYKLAVQGHHLRNFVSYLEATNASRVTIEHAVEWATCAGTDETYWGDRLSVARQFARHLQLTDAACQVPRGGCCRSAGAARSPTSMSPRRPPR
jgi:integrase/recombinase XerD